MEISPRTASIPRLMVGFQSVRPEERGHGITVGSGAREIVGGVILAKVGAVSCVGDSGFPRRGGARGNKTGRWRQVGMLRIMVPLPALT
jgi:hypothetical protein